MPQDLLLLTLREKASMTRTTKDAQLRTLLPEELYQYLPTPEQAALGAVGLGVLGYGYGLLRPKLKDKQELLSPRKIRIALPRRHAEEDLEKTSQAAKEEVPSRSLAEWLAAPGFKGGLALGAATPFGLYGAWKGYEAWQQDQHRRRLQRGLQRIEDLTDYSLPDAQLVSPRRLRKAGAALESLADTLAEREFQKRGGSGVGDAWKTLSEVGGTAVDVLSDAGSLLAHSPFVLGGLFGTGALGSYLLTRRQLLPPAALKPRPDPGLAQLSVRDLSGKVRARGPYAY